MNLFSRQFGHLLQHVGARALHDTGPLRKSQITSGGLKRINCTLIPGDGVGPELVCALQSVFNALEIPMDFERFHLSENDPKSADLKKVIQSIEKNKICIKGVMNTPLCGTPCVLQTLNMKFRNALDLYANVVHVRSVPGVKLRHKDIDTLIIREMTEGEYSALEHEVVPGVVECLKIITARKSLRIAEFAYQYATKCHRKKITIVHKANIMKLTDGMFMKTCQMVAKKYPAIKTEAMIVDNTAMQMVSNPHQFDILLTPNLYGNILDNLAAGMVGGAGMVPGYSYSERVAVFEPGARHPYEGAVGKNIANPTAMFLCGCKLLRHIGQSLYADVIEKSLLKVLKEGKVRTPDLGGNCGTSDFTDAVINNLCSIK